MVRWLTWKFRTGEIPHLPSENEGKIPHQDEIQNFPRGKIPPRNPPPPPVCAHLYLSLKTDIVGTFMTSCARPETCTGPGSHEHTYPATDFALHSPNAITCLSDVASGSISGQSASGVGHLKQPGVAWDECSCIAHLLYQWLLSTSTHHTRSWFKRPITLGANVDTTCHKFWRLNWSCQLGTSTKCLSSRTMGQVGGRVLLSFMHKAMYANQVSGHRLSENMCLSACQSALVLQNWACAPKQSIVLSRLNSLNTPHTHGPSPLPHDNGLTCGPHKLRQSGAGDAIE